ncbi:MAG: mechanosensitive ion channel family protein [Treponema sp.]|nr:mechanosensitive ion channel family protein [Treponema sp.]
MNVTSGFFDDVLGRMGNMLSGELILRVLGSITMAFAIIVTFNVLQLFIGRLLKNRISFQRTFIIKKTIKYTGFVMAVLFLFGSMGIDTTALLGAAGIIGIAVGFAAQTTVSSFISGFFLLSEKPFQVGDVIRVDQLVGEVLSVDVLSVKIRTFDNLYVRIPNETLFKSNLVNLTRFPIRRLDILFNVTYQADLEKVQDLVTEIARGNPYVLDNPAPHFRVDQFDRVGPLVNLTVWFDRNQLLEVRTSMYMAVQKRLAQEGIEIPYQKFDIKVDGGDASRLKGM